MSDGFHLRVLGFPELRRPEGRLIKLKVRKHMALLIYFVVEAREVFRREELADLLWPGAPEKNSRHSLSTALSVLRGVFGPDCIRGTHTEVRFSAPALRIDLQRLEGGKLSGSETGPPVDVDGFLRDFHIADALGFQHWRDRRQAQLLPVIQGGIQALMDAARRSADLPRLRLLADRLLTLDPLAEEAIQARMEALALQGDRVAALRVFEEWKKDLAEELDAAPSATLRALAERLRRPALLAPGARESRPEGKPGMVFVGRAGEFRALFEAWELAAEFTTSLVLLTGERGIGKSALAARFAEAVALQGAAVARVRCFEAEREIEFAMMGSLVRGLLECPGALGTAPDSLAEVARMVPAVRERFRHLPAPRRMAGESARLHFAEGLGGVLEAILEEQPVVLIVDDFPHSDEASHSVLHLLLRQAANRRLMVVMVAGLAEAGEAASATRIRQAWSALPLRRIELNPLSETESDALLQAVLAQAGKTAPAPERRALLRSAGGNPLALELLSQDWVAHGDSALAVLLPAMRRDVLCASLRHAGEEGVLPALTPRTRIAAYLAAILGDRLNDLTYFNLVEFSEAQALAALSDLVAHRVLRNTDRGLGFSNELVRGKVYVGMPEPARLRLHHAVAGRLLGAVADGITIPGLEVAWHCIRAHRRDDALPFLISGSRAAIKSGEPDQAVRALSSALGGLRGRGKAEATLLLAETYQEMAEWKAALECIDALKLKAKTDRNLIDRAKIIEIESRHRLGEYHIDALQSMAEDLVNKARACEDVSSRLRAARIAIGISSTLRTQALIPIARDAVAGIPIHSLDKTEASRGLLVRALARYTLREGEKGMDEVLAAQRLLEQEGAADTLFVEVQIGLGAIACANGLYNKAIAPLERAHAAAMRLENSPLIGQAATNLSLCHSRLGMVDEHLRWATIAWSKAGSSPPGSYARVLGSAQRGLASLDSGKPREAFEAIEELRSSRAASQVPWVQQAATIFEADLNWFLGKRNTALRLIEEMIAERPEPDTIGLVGRVVRWTTVLSINSRNLELAREATFRSYQRLAQLDALDQAEVLCSMANLGRFGERLPAGVRRKARAVLARLPKACSQRLEKLGLRIPN